MTMASHQRAMPRRGIKCFSSCEKEHLGSKYFSRYLGTYLGTQPWSVRALPWPLTPLADPCQTLVEDPSLAARLPPQTTWLAWLEPGKHHGPTPTYRTAPLSTTPTASRRVSLCAHCCAPTRPSRPSQRLRRPPVPHPHHLHPSSASASPSPSSSSRALASLVRLSPFLLSLARLLFPLLPNRNLRSTILLSALSYPFIASTDRTDRIRA
jgi:hypothetical protein